MLFLKASDVKNQAARFRASAEPQRHAIVSPHPVRVAVAKGGADVAGAERAAGAVARPPNAERKFSAPRRLDGALGKARK